MRQSKGSERESEWGNDSKEYHEKWGKEKKSKMDIWQETIKVLRFLLRGIVIQGINEFFRWKTDEGDHELSKK